MSDQKANYALVPLCFERHDEETRIHLSQSQFARLVEILEDSTPPSQSLILAMRDYQAAKKAFPDRGL